MSFFRKYKKQVPNAICLLSAADFLESDTHCDSFLGVWRDTYYVCELTVFKLNPDSELLWIPTRVIDTIKVRESPSKARWKDNRAYKKEQEAKNELEPYLTDRRIIYPFWLDIVHETIMVKLEISTGWYCLQMVDTTVTNKYMSRLKKLICRHSDKFFVDNRNLVRRKKVMGFKLENESVQFEYEILLQDI